MWVATIKSKGIVEKSFLVNISYTNGVFDFNEVINLTGGSLQSLNDQIAAKLDLLETTQALIPLVTTGVFTPVISPATARNIFIDAKHRFESCQKAVSLNLILSSSTTYTQAEADMQAAFTTALIDYV